MPSRVDRQSLGKLGETLACRELRRRGYAILARRYRTRFGEIDIVCRRGPTLVFVEVKARSGRRHGTAAESVTKLKRRRVAAMALDYLSRNRRLDRYCRFDVIAIDAIGTTDQQVRVIENAFQLDG